MQEQPVFFHYHLPKTGGQTIRDALVRSLDHGTTFVHLGLWSRQAGVIPHSNEQLADLSCDERGLIRVVVGHGVNSETLALFEGRPSFEFTALRDPAERMVSHFNFDRHIAERRGEEPVDFETWYGARKKNEMTGKLLKCLDATPASLEKRLDELDFIGDTAEMDAWLPRLFDVMGVPSDVPPRVNVTGVDHQRVRRLDADLRARIQNDHPLDATLYERAPRRWFGPTLERLTTSADRAARIRAQ